MISTSKDIPLLMEARRYWECMASWRQKRERCKRYCYGDQWGDMVMVDGMPMREEEYIRSLGSEPLKNNLIRRLVKQVLGLYRSEPFSLKVSSEDHSSAKLMNSLLSKTQSDNSMTEVNARALEEFLISGLVVQRKTFGWRDGRCGCWTENVMPGHFIIDPSMSDNRGWDVEFIGEIHDLRLGAVIEHFAHDSSDVERLSAIYSTNGYRERIRKMADEFGTGSFSEDAFSYAASNGLCRVIEVWRRQRQLGYLCHDRSSGLLQWVSPSDVPSLEGNPSLQLHWHVRDEWRYCYLTPFGDVLAEGVSPYSHQGHPYVFKAYPFVDGEIHSFVADVIDQQRYTNRLITLYDWVMRSSAKGVLLVPEESIPEGLTIGDVADEWARFNGVIPVRTRNGCVMPQQVSANAVNIGINELLQTQLGFMEDISGVTGSLQGKTSNAGVSGNLYEMQTHNASLSLLDLLDSFRHFISEATMKDVRNIQQFYGTMAVPGISDQLLDRFLHADFRVG